MPRSREPASSFDITHTTQSGPPPMEWQEYKRRVQAAWQALLDSSPGEPAVQSFLEQHPSLVPGSHSALGRLTSGHGPFPSALITQPSLAGLGERTPDFVWISRDSAFLNPVFIEIEDPDKPWITQKGEQHHKLTQALGQLRQWREWFNDPVNRQVFFKKFQVPDLFTRRKWEPIWVLIYGRQRDDERIAKLRADLQDKTQRVIPYEHLEPDPEARDFMCVRNTTGRYRAVSIPATVRLHPGSAEDWALIEGKETAASASEWMTPERRDFLVERFPYWDAWARDGGRAWRSRDFE
jgi:hypothetical protein